MYFQLAGARDAAVRISTSRGEVPSDRANCATIRKTIYLKHPKIPVAKISRFLSVVNADEKVTSKRVKLNLSHPNCRQRRMMSSCPRAKAPKLALRHLRGRVRHLSWSGIWLSQSERPTG